MENSCDQILDYIMENSYDQILDYISFYLIFFNEFLSMQIGQLRNFVIDVNAYLLLKYSYTCKLL